jgi:hypothetical protein
MAPVASIEAYIPMEVRVRMSGREYNDVKVVVRQVNPNNPREFQWDELTIERMPGQPRDNPFGDGTPSAPVLVKVHPGWKVTMMTTYNAYPDENDPTHPQAKTHGSNPTYVFLDFPLEDDYDPRDDDQSTQGHHYTYEYKFEGSADPFVVKTEDLSANIKDKKGVVIGTSIDDSSDDAQFHWSVISGSMSLPPVKTFYNDGSEPDVPGSFRDAYPSPWNGTAPAVYRDIYEFVYTTGFTLSLYTLDDDGGRSNTATLLMN